MAGYYVEGDIVLSVDWEHNRVILTPETSEGAAWLQKRQRPSQPFHEVCVARHGDVGRLIRDMVIAGLVVDGLTLVRLPATHLPLDEEEGAE